MKKSNAVTFASINNHISHWKMFKPWPTFWMGGNLLDSLCTASSVSMCMWTTPGTIWCKLRTCSALTPPSVHTLSTKRDTILITAAPISPGSCSSNPDSASALSLSGTLYHTKHSYISINTVAHWIMQHTATSPLQLPGTLHRTAHSYIIITTHWHSASYRTLPDQHSHPLQYCIIQHRYMTSTIFCHTASYSKQPHRHYHCGTLHHTTQSQISILTFKHTTSHSITTLCHNAL